MTTNTRNDETGEVLLDRLLSTNVVTTTADDSLRLSESFLDCVERHEEAISRLSSDEREDLLYAVAPRDSEAAAVLKVGSRTNAIQAEYVALREREDVDEEVCYRAMALMDVFRGNVRTGEGAPEPYVPVRARRLPLLTTVHERAVVYVWMEDCDPCELIRDDLENVYEDVPDEIGLFTVYGPANADYLFDEYRVDGAPTLLYFLGGDVDVRLRGPTERAVIETEFEKLAELAVLPKYTSSSRG